MAACRRPAPFHAAAARLPLPPSWAPAGPILTRSCRRRRWLLLGRRPRRRGQAVWATGPVLTTAAALRCQTGPPSFSSTPSPSSPPRCLAGNPADDCCTDRFFFCLSAARLLCGSATALAEDAAAMMALARRRGCGGKQTKQPGSAAGFLLILSWISVNLLLLFFSLLRLLLLWLHLRPLRRRPRSEDQVLSPA